MKNLKYSSAKLNTICIQSEQLRGRRTVLFGAGEYGVFTHLLYKNDMDVAYFCDNDQKKWGQVLNGVPIYSPEKLKEESEDTCIIITSMSHFDDIIDQLKHMGLCPGFNIVKLEYPKRLLTNFFGFYRFIDNRKNKSKLLVILAGYKDFLWDTTLRRMAEFTTDDIDVCVASSGLYDQRLEELCIKNQWSYVSTQANKVSLVQNIAIQLHPNAEFIYKLDEDMFICKDFFSELHKALIHAEQTERYSVGLIAPIIPINAHGHILFLKKAGLLDEFDKKFGKAIYTLDSCIRSNSDVAKYLWEKSLPLDAYAEQFKNDGLTYYICPHKFSIGAILFRRLIWEDIEGFEVGQENTLGSDEVGLAIEFLVHGQYRTFVIAENVIAGHLCFSVPCLQEDIKNFYLENKELFSIPENYK